MVDLSSRKLTLSGRKTVLYPLGFSILGGLQIKLDNRKINRRKGTFYSLMVKHSEKCYSKEQIEFEAFTPLAKEKTSPKCHMLLNLDPVSCLLAVSAPFRNVTLISQSGVFCSNIGMVICHMPPLHFLPH